MKQVQSLFPSKIICLFGILLLISCAKKAKEHFVTIDSFSGSAELVRNEEKKAVVQDGEVLSGDIVKTGKGSCISIRFNKTRVLYLNENSNVKIKYLWEESDSSLSISVRLITGEVFSEFLSSSGISSAYTVATPFVSVIGKKSSFDVINNNVKNVSILKAFEGQVNVYPVNQEPVDLAPCNKILVTEDGKVSRLVSLIEEDTDELKTWIDKNRVESLLANSDCFSAPKEDLSPKWEGEPKKSCRPGIAFTDKLIAKDPEGKAVRYFLLKAPRGMTISETDGVVSYKPKKTGTFEVQVSAEDESGNTSPRNYFLTVVGNLNAVLRTVESIKAGVEFTLDASRSVDALGEKKGLLYRFDLNGDGTWNGAFAAKSVQKHRFTRAGEFRVAVQVKDSEGKTAVAKRTITVTVPPEIKLSYIPLAGSVGTEYTLMVTPKDPARKLSVRWDLNGDGRWDYPSQGFADEKQVRHMWDKPGTYTVKVEAEDAGKNRVSAAIEIPVYEGITIEGIQCPDTVNINEKISVVCSAKDPRFKIVEYGWDYAGVGMFHEKTKEPKITCSYKEAGIYTFVCSATNEKGMSASASKDIVVLNFTTTIDAGGPYKSFVNKAFTVKGLAKDVDNKITSFSWDFDNDKKYEWTSKKTSVAQHTFSHQGNYVVRFSAKLDDGSVSEDTAVVTIVNRSPKASAGEDIIARKNRKIELNGSGSDPDKNIVKYEWDFDNNGTFDWSSKDTGFTEHAFPEFSTPVLKVTDTEGAEAFDTVNIVICPKGMEIIKEGRYCIDTYEWPNKRKEVPKTSVTYDQAAASCEKAGKRLCTLKEMTNACRGGKEKYSYPYGRKYEPDMCNSYGNRHIKNKKGPSGDFPECKSRYGVFDMSGNVAEWVSNGEGKSKYVVGGWWQNGDKQARCGAYVPLDKKKKFHYVGFRCCK